MNELKKMITDIRFLIPALFFVGFELFMQSGLYRKLLQPNSFADNVNRIVKIAGSSDINPQVLILGTSVAYQGILLPDLNARLESEGWRAQSGASEGAMLITQNMIYRTLKKKMPDLKLVVHVAEATFPWTARYDLNGANRSMTAQFDRPETIKRLGEYDYELSSDDYSYYLVRSLTYQKDIRDFALNPLERIKRLGREYRKYSQDKPDYPYVNEHQYAMSAYPAHSLKECVKVAKKGVPETDETGKQITDRHHRKAVWQTCEVGMSDPMSYPGASHWEKLFFKRLQLFYREIQDDGVRVVTVFPPYSSLIKDLNEGKRMGRWHKNLKELYGSDEYLYLDLRSSLDSPDNADLYYDTIHLNRKGARRFTHILTDRITELKEKIIIDP